ncbi:MAG: D-alanine--D-alanine ligase [Firmicutes bacterium]|nr:D-alanine--D-alanine ligase [Bacillota bacterium]
MKLAVILGGTSSEREISLKSGDAIYKSLLRNGYEVDKIDPKYDDLYRKLKSLKPDSVFIALHGLGGEDGSIQGFLEQLKIPYTGSKVLASSLCMNKIYTQTIMKAHNIPVPEFFTVKKKDYNETDIKRIVNKIEQSFGFPVLVKAPSQGSTLGIYFINSTKTSYEQQLKAAFTSGFELENELLIEKMITPNDEITIGLLGNDKAFPLPTLEITTVTGYYDYDTKYTKGMCEHIIPARLPEAVRNKAKKLAVEIYEILGCKGFARADFMVKGNEIYLIDINTIPGFTEMSLLPDAAASIGITFDMLTNYIIQMSLGHEFPFEKYKDLVYEK